MTKLTEIIRKTYEFGGVMKHSGKEFRFYDCSNCKNDDEVSYKIAKTHRARHYLTFHADYKPPKITGIPRIDVRSVNDRYLDGGDARLWNDYDKSFDDRGSD